MNQLVPCPSCARHVRQSESACPFCSVALALEHLPAPVLPRGRLGRAATFAFGASLVGATSLVACGGDSETGQQGGGAGATAGGSSASGSNAGGSSAGGAGAGGGNTAGTSAGGTNAAGTNTGGATSAGTHAGGSSSGGAQTGGAGGANSAGHAGSGGNGGNGGSGGGGGVGGNIAQPYGVPPLGGFGPAPLYGSPPQP